MIKVNKVYNAANGERFLILAKKNRASSNGCSFIGENVKSGLVTFFNHLGENCVRPEWQLRTDFYKWIGIIHGKVSNPTFLNKEELDKHIKYSGYLRIENDEEHSIVYQSVSSFQVIYA